ncbi:IucA/IucC family siderophore biosynthesis protein [Paenibacillus sp. XY044]|uniref:IucA/IucC family protein n=1 Tax=Paenibacillus sp. XY044 TaxID=2026089 RepID=UPI000B998CDF|nr:IucA/IucC family protein [Paenibacillus sp. XY044]OZB95305.1 hypothetical protein CJP46_16655 [Paenibacillus sp. XY044]
MLMGRKPVSPAEIPPPAMDKEENLAEERSGASAGSLAERHAVQLAARSLLNAFLRENEDAVERMEILAEAAEMGAAVPLTLLLSDGTRIHGSVRYASLTGQHLYEEEWLLERCGSARVLPFDELAEALVREQSLRLGPGAAVAAPGTLKRIQASVRHLRGHLERREADEQAGLDVRKLDYIRSEQSVLAGHPFHPYPKSVEGMNETDLIRFSPERGASFLLHYFAVRSSCLICEWLPDAFQGTLPPEACETFRRALKEGLGSQAAALYEPLPMHPWQADRLLEQPWIEQAVQRGELVPLGPLGPRVYPTSSVRTVWEPHSGYGWKLPLEVRITNLVRVNTAEQTSRTMHAVRLAAHLGGELESELPGLLPETGYSGIAVHGQAMPDPAASVLIRPMALEPTATFVLASLLEGWPGEQMPKLAQAITESGRSGGAQQLPDMLEWLERYLRLSMLPLLRVWDRFGISFEAHAQNSLLSLADGWPVKFYVRDLEGMSVDRRLAEKAGWVGDVLPKDSPLLYEAADAWHRTLYYFFVNHLGSLIHALALWQGWPEREGWSVVRHLLVEEREWSSERLRPYVDGLLNHSTLPAKANFASCLANKGDTPLYISIHNPIRDGRRP